MRVNSLTELNLHDSDLIDFVMPVDDSSEVVIHLDYIDDYQTLRTAKRSLVFSGCVKVVIDANLLVTPDSLRTGHELKNSSMLSEVKEKLTKSGFPAPDELKHFYLETNSNASIFNVIAESVDLRGPED